LLENLLVAQHNKLHEGVGFTLLGLFGFASYRRASKASIELARHWLEKARLVDRADDPAGDLPYGAQRRLEIATGHVHPVRNCFCLDEPAAGLNRGSPSSRAVERYQGYQRDIDLLNRARHVGGHGNFRPRGGCSNMGARSPTAIRRL